MVLIFSWNVAGFSTTIRRIRENYSDYCTNQLGGINSNVDSFSRNGTNNRNINNKRKRNSTFTIPSTPSPLGFYFGTLHQADIVCIQEHKIPKHALSNRLEPDRCSTIVRKRTITNDDGTKVHIDEEYESYWACCTDDNFKGLNGVVTYAKKGTVLCANGTSILQSSELDSQGRCVMTEHTNFILFNVYVPASCGQSLSYKMKFLNALRRSMQNQRQKKKKPIILVGDLNISHTIYDVHWKDRVVYVQEIIDFVAQHQRQQKRLEDTNNKEQSAHLPKLNLFDEERAETATIPQWKLDIATHWKFIESVLQTKEVVSTQTTNSRTNEKYNKFRLMVHVPVDDATKNHKNTFSTTTMSKKEQSSTEKQLNRTTTTTSISSTSPSASASSPSSSTTRQIYLGVHETDPMYCSYRYDFRCCTYYDEDSEQHKIAKDQNCIPVGILIELMSKIVNVNWSDTIQRSITSTMDRSSPTRQWLTTLLNEDQMIDSFRYLYPTANGRFTCWNQHTNQRYSNVGARIDYTIIDQSLLPSLLRGQKGTLSSPLFSTPIINTATTTCTTTVTRIKVPVQEEESTCFLRCGCTTMFVTIADTNSTITDATTQNKISNTTNPINSSIICNNGKKNITIPTSTRLCSVTPTGYATALCAATGGGMYEPAGFEGNGMIEASTKALQKQFGIPHTGHVYTPPTYSDHIGVSLLICDDYFINNSTWTIPPTKEELLTTKQAQPHKLQKSIASFFTKSDPTTRPITSSATHLQNVDDATSAAKSLYKKNGKVTSIHGTLFSTESLSKHDGEPTAIPTLSKHDGEPTANPMILVQKKSNKINLNSRKPSTSSNSTRKRHSAPSPRNNGNILHHFQKQTSL